MELLNKFLELLNKLEELKELFGANKLLELLSQLELVSGTAAGNTTNVTAEEDPYPQICNRTCNIGYTGIKCSRCKPHYFRTASQECQSCDVLSTDPEEAKALYGMIGFAGFIVFVIGLWFFLSTDPFGFLYSCLNGECCDSDEEIRIKAMKKEAEEDMLEETIYILHPLTAINPSKTSQSKSQSTTYPYKDESSHKVSIFGYIFLFGTK